MKYYESTTGAVYSRNTIENPWRSWRDSELKSRREDFNDMFMAECDYRAERGDISIVFVLTYNDEHLCHKYGQNLLDADHLKMFSKSSRFAKMLRRKYGYEFDFVCVGEYGNGGKSHNKVGQRGVGQNPHFHCAGWFHKVADVELPAGFVPERDLPLLIRQEWQRCSEYDIIRYAASPELRALGLGFVCLDGPIRSKKNGGSYISKYISKDIQSLYCEIYLKGFCRYLCPALCCALRSANVPEFMPYLDIVRSWCVFRLLVRGRRPLKDLQLLAEYLKDRKVDFNPLSFYFDIIDDILSETYKNYLDDFYAELNKRHSPKLRKFQGFGYSLMKYADIEKTTYTVHRKCGAVTRFLPPSLVRHFYYDHHVCLVHQNLDGSRPKYCTKNLPFVPQDVEDNPCKCVVYTLNELGRKALRVRLVSQVLYARLIVEKLGSPLLMQNCTAVLNFVYCLRSWFIDVQKYKFHSSVIFDFAACVDLSLTFRQQSVFLTREVSSVPLASLDSFFYDTFDWLKPCVKEFDDIMLSVRSAKNEKDMEFNRLWRKCYLSTF